MADEETVIPEVTEEVKETKPERPRPGGNLLLFGKFDVSGIVVSDLGLAKYINLQPVSYPHTGARHANRHMGKTKVSIVERLVNNMMRNENFTGKKTKAYSVVEESFQVISEKTKKNPVQILIDAIQNSAPREEVTRLRLGGISVPKAVDVSPARRLDIALRNISKGAVAASYKKRTSIQDCLANEVILAAKNDINSFAVSKKDEVERVAASAR